MKLKSFFSAPRNLIALIVCCACLIVNIAGLIWGGVRHANGSLADEKFNYILQQGIVGCFTIFIIYAAEWLFRFRAPLATELSCTLFAFMGNTVAAVYDAYILFPDWDKLLHTLAGVLFAAIGLSLAATILKGKMQGRQKILFCCLIAFLIVLAEGYLWEIFEYTIDSFGTSNAQRWANGIIESYPDGTYLVNDRRGTGLIDTMTDMIVNLIGAVVFLVPMMALFLKRPASMDAFGFRPLPPFRKKKTDDRTDEPAGDPADDRTDEKK